MERITRQSLANEAKDEWGKTYGTTESTSKYGLDKIEIYNELCKLGDTPNPDDVDRVIGNEMWTHVYCNECGEKADSGIQLGEEPDYDSSTAIVCDACMKKAMEIINHKK